MFVYGKDIPLDDAVADPAAASAGSELAAAEPTEFVFEYGKDVYPDTATGE